MFDLRYHVASLAAVFVALAVGIVIGVAIAGGGNLEETTAGIEQGQLDDLNKQLEEAQARGDRLASQNEAVQRLMDETYEPLMAERQPAVVEAEQVQERGVEIVSVDRIFGHAPA